MKGVLKNVMKVASSNVITLLAGIVVSLFLPKIISMTDYSNYKIFTLYTSYMGVLLFGFNDGIYLKYAGVSYADVDRKRFRTFHFYILLLTLLVAGLLLTSSFFIKNEYGFILLALGLYLIPFNIIGYYQQVSQITQRFNEYSVVKIINALFSVFIVAVIFTFSKTNHENLATYKTYIVGLIIANAFVALWYVFKYREIIFGERFTLRSEKKEVFSLHKIGLPLLIANLTTLLFLNLDRQVVSMFYDKITYALYAFAYNIMTLISTVISAVSIVLYPTLKNSGEEERKELYPALVATIIFVAFACLLSYFPISVFIPWFLPNYTNSLEILRVIFPSIVFNSVINVIIYNYYKIYGKTKQFLIISLIMLVLSAILNVVAVCLDSIILISAMTVVSMLVWFIVVDVIIRRIHKDRDIRVYLFLAINLIGYYLALWIPAWWIGMAAYLLCLGVSYILLLHRSLKEFLRSLVKRGR